MDQKSHGGFREAPTSFAPPFQLYVANQLLPHLFIKYTTLQIRHSRDAKTVADSNLLKVPIPPVSGGGGVELADCFSAMVEEETLDGDEMVQRLLLFQDRFS